jgi:hypothetical protein
LYFFSEERFQIIEDFNQSVTVLGLKYTFWRTRRQEGIIQDKK